MFMVGYGELISTYTDYHKKASCDPAAQSDINGDMRLYLHIS